MTTDELRKLALAIKDGRAVGGFDLGDDLLKLLDIVEAAKALEAEASKRLRFRDAERYPELCAALTQVRTALAELEGK